MGRYTSYGIATSYAIPLEELDKVIKRRLWGKSVADVSLEDLHTIYPKSVYDIQKTEKCIVVTLKDSFNGTDIFSLLKDFAAITPFKQQLPKEDLEKIGEQIIGKSLDEVLEFADSRKYEGFQDIELPYYLYQTIVPVGDKKVYSDTQVKGILIGYAYSKTDTEDDSDPYEFLTTLLRYRLKENPLAPTLLAYLSV